MKEKLMKGHLEIFNQEATSFYFSPGRVNLIGEHVDYSGGHVLPMALTVGTYASVSKREDKTFKIFSENFKDLGILSTDLDHLDYHPDASYLNYIKGMIYKLKWEKHDVSQGLNIYIYGDLPTSAGLSSSASIELLIGKILEQENTLDIELLKLVKYAKYVENSYMGLSSGIMDQYAIAFGKKDHAIFLDTKNLTHEYVPFKLKDHTLVLMNTNRLRNLVDSKYNERAQAVEVGRKHFLRLRPIKELCDLDITSFCKLKDTLNDPSTIKRVEHVVFENHRTIQARDALEFNDIKMFGDFMNQSHESLKYLFEVSCEELDYLVDYHISQGALGARMTGAGFGGTMIALYENDKLPKNFDALKEAYYKLFKKELDIIASDASDGVRKLEGDF
ncbi:galactokinase [Liberiplasma polymorphum]|uniref:galactokinase n=1 Tax=Liberiplasma polymorphum TaxID=3374570 RepID=UPI003770AFE2